ncbi:MAG: EamA family transporter [Flavipsychrobacter sp.]|jgi:drug/metabolite transporter (DMT)-like permease|nr:EamA family transporter [Flavipsychrobacter sp.]
MEASLILFTTLAVLVRIFSNAFSNVFQKQLLQKGNDALLISFYTYLLLSIACIPAVLYLGGFTFSTEFWLYSIAGGLAGAAGNAFLVKALERGELSVLGPINAYKSIVGILTGMLLLQEYPNYAGILGILLIIGGSYYVLDSPGEPFSLRLFRKKEIQYRLLALVLTGIEAVFIKRVMLASSTEWAFISWCFFGALFSLLLLLVLKIPVTTALFNRKNGSLKLAGLLVVSVGAMQLSTIFVLDKMPVGYALALFQLSIIVTVWLGHRIFGEANLRQKLIGSIIMLIGSVLILLSK